MKTVPMTEELYQYVMKFCPLPHPILKKVEEETAIRKDKGMQISRDQGAFMHMLAKLMNAENAIEVGCFTGYSAISIAMGLSKTGKLYTLDIDEDTAKVAKKYFADAGLANKIEHLLGPANKSLDTLAQKVGKNRFDIAFVDADKTGYLGYYEQLLTLIRPGGIIIADNVIWGGSVIDSTQQSDDTKAVRKFAEVVSRDERVDVMMLHISDGLLLIRKKEINEK
ncbi:MAG: O-methyltransferase [Oligoflexales bacterium]